MGYEKQGEELVQAPDQYSVFSQHYEKHLQLKGLVRFLEA